MIARHEGRVLLVLGAIPGERVRARITRVERQLAYAEVVDVLEPSEARRTPAVDLPCGGCLYAHIRYPDQLTLKARIVEDAFQRIARIPLARSPIVKPSPERAYRMRARLHVQGRRAGFYREGTHDLCDARSTGQLTESAVEAATSTVAALARAGHVASSVEIAETIAADARILLVWLASDQPPEPALLEALVADGLAGVTAVARRGTRRTAGKTTVSDPLAVVTGGRAASGTLARHAESFFQANRFLVPDLVTEVLGHVPPGGDVLDLYAGVGLFAVGLAAAGRHGITAVEGDRSSGRDLQQNAAPFGAQLRVVLGRVEDVMRRTSRRAGTLIVDPPRTGLSRAAMGAVAGHAARRVIYVSCDPATMARDARHLLDAGLSLRGLQAFDLFPNTPHVETVAWFDRP